MSDEYIKREDALSAQNKSMNLAECRKRLERLPEADVVEVVRCRECKYREEDNFCTGRGWPQQMVADDGFCEKGKRKER